MAESAETIMTESEETIMAACTWQESRTIKHTGSLGTRLASALVSFPDFLGRNEATLVLDKYIQDNNELT